MRAQASAFFPLLLTSLNQLNSQCGWPGWIALTTGPSLRWEKKKKSRGKIIIAGIPICRDCNMQLQRLQDDSRRLDALHLHRSITTLYCTDGLRAGCSSIAGGFGIPAAAFVLWQSWPGSAWGYSSQSSTWKSLRVQTLPSYFMHEINGATNWISCRNGMAVVSSSLIFSNLVQWKCSSLHAYKDTHTQICCLGSFPLIPSPVLQNYKKAFRKRRWRWDESKGRRRAVLAAV